MGLDRYTLPEHLPLYPIGLPRARGTRTLPLLIASVSSDSLPPLLVPVRRLILRHGCVFVYVWVTPQECFAPWAWP